MKNKAIKKVLAVGMSALLFAATGVPTTVQAAGWKQNTTGWWWQDVEGRGVEPCRPRERGGRHAVARGQRVDRGPDAAMRKQAGHGVGPLAIMEGEYGTGFNSHP